MGISNWTERALENLHSLSETEKEYLLELCEKFRRKNSKRLVNFVADEIADVLGIENPLIFCKRWKFEGVYGIHWTAERTIGVIERVL